MKYEMFSTLLDQAERDFEVEATEIDPNPTDTAEDTIEREIAVGILAETNETLDEIRAARRRLLDGTFGRCESCGKEIDLERLRAVPWARRCLADECLHSAEVSGSRNRVDVSPWLLDVAPEIDGDDCTWDPEDDHPAPSAEESAVHAL